MLSYKSKLQNLLSLVIFGLEKLCFSKKNIRFSWPEDLSFNRKDPRVKKCWDLLRKSSTSSPRMTKGGEFFNLLHRLFFLICYCGRPSRLGKTFSIAWLAGMTLEGALSSPALAEIRIESPWVRASTGPNAALFMTLVNTGETPEKLTSAHIDACAHTELHTHVEENGIFRMREVDFIDIPAGGSTDLKPGGHHVMLMKIHAPLQEGDEIPVTLSFEKSDAVTLIAPVKGMGGGCCHKR